MLILVVGVGGLVVGVVVTRLLLGNPEIYAWAVFDSVLHFSGPPTFDNQHKVNLYFMDLAQRVVAARKTVLKSQNSLYFDVHIEEKKQLVRGLELQFAFARFVAISRGFSAQPSPDDYVRK